jgi:hypothetical protein
MHRAFRAALPCVLAAGLSCSSSSHASTPAPTPAPAAGGGAAQAAGGGQAQGQAAGGGGQRGGGAPGAPGGGRGPQMTPEQRAARRASLDTLRAGVVADLMKQIAGHEKDPAGQVFKNVTMPNFKTMAADQFLTTMDKSFGVALGVGCTFCHEANNQWDADSKDAKKTARIMVDIVAAINKEQMPKMPNARPPQIQCVTCHRGNSSPGRALTP